MPIIDESRVLDLLNFDCRVKQDQLNNINWYVFNPKQKRANFFTLGVGGVIVFDQEVYESHILSLFEMAGEIIPIKAEKETFYVLNVLECVNVLDHNRSEWDVYPNGQKGRLLKYSFFENRVTESCIFKIPETSKTEILTYTGLKDSLDEFYGLYKEKKFTGLTFVEI